MILFSNETLILIIIFFVAFINGYIAYKFLDRSFILWFLVSLLVPVLSILILLFIGYDGIYCPRCLKKIRKNNAICPHCQFDIEKHNAIISLNKSSTKKK